MSSLSSIAPPPAVGDVLRRYWGYDALRPLQAEAIDAALQGRDSLVVLPTGGGKSLCYQIPPAVANRTDVVISPLIALMKDQVDGLRACGYPAAAVHSHLSPDERRDIANRSLAGELRLLFLAPESLQNPRLLDVLRRIDVRAFAIDEAHCISHWGHDFRVDYRTLARLRDRFPDASLHAYTATATQRVRDDIVAQLALRDPAVLVGGFDRPNLVYRVLPKRQAAQQTLDVLMRHRNEAAIVYCLSRNDTERLAARLQQKGVRCAFYHAGMDADDRRQTQEAFANETINVVIATVAFGMGIDRSNVRCVIHTTLPKSIEHYQQEAGRAGRDGLEAECVLLYSYADIARWENLLERSAAESDGSAELVAAGRAMLEQMQRYASSLTCRRRQLVAYFGQTLDAERCDACDVCLGEVQGAQDETITAQKILSCVARVEQRFGVQHVVDVLQGADTERIRMCGHQHLSTYGLLKDVDKTLLRSFVHQLLDQGLLTRSTGDYPVLVLNDESWRVMRGQRRVTLRIDDQPVKKARVEGDAWRGVDRELFDMLRALRKEIAAERGVPPFTVMHDATLRELASVRPSTLEALRGVKGLGAKKIRDFGERVLACLDTECAERGLSRDAVDNI